MAVQAAERAAQARGRQRTANEYADLKRMVTERGLLTDQNGYYWLKAAAGLATVAVAVAVALTSPWPALTLVDAVFLAFAFTQMALLAHDVGHSQAFRGRSVNSVARLVSGNLLLGISHSWWSVKHNQHHATPNHVDKDPDIRFPFLAFSPEQVALRPRALRPVLSVQAFVFVLLFPLQALHMRFTSARHLLVGNAPQPVLQALVMAVHMGLYGLLLFELGSWPIALGFAAIHQGTFGFYNSLVFASNHKGMALIREGARLDFLREQVLTSRNVRSHPLTDFWYGGLNYQIEHHLFPTMPRNNFGRAQGLVRAFCEERGVSYHTTGLFGAYREGFLHLHRAGKGRVSGASAPGAGMVRSPGS